MMLSVMLSILRVMVRSIYQGGWSISGGYVNTTVVLVVWGNQRIEIRIDLQQSDANI